LRNGKLKESASLLAPEVIARKIFGDLEAARKQIATVAEDLKK
jgi:hypothetical protein